MTALFTTEKKMEALFDENGKLKMTDEMDKRLQKELGPKVDIAKLKKDVEEEYADMLKAKNKDEDPNLAEMREKAKKALLTAHKLSEEESNKVLETASENTPKTEMQLLEALTQKVEDQNTLVQKLMADPEGDAPEAIVKGNKNNMKHSDTHLMGNGQAYNAFQNRPWNQLAAGQDVDMPTFAADSPEVQTLKNDMDLYYREVNSNLSSLFRDFLKLPSFWPVRTNVTDRVADGNIVSAEITQARKKGWLPKNKQLIQPEEAKIYPVQVDIEQAGYHLQTILTSWLHQYNKEGSQAYKWSFVRFLLSELDKKARQEDRIVAVKGVHVPTPETTQIPGLAIHRSDGLLIKLFRAFYYEMKYRAALIGKPTEANIVDYVKKVVEVNIPEEERNNPGLVLYLSKQWLRTHIERKRVIFGSDNNYTGQELMDIENYPNVKLCALDELARTDFMFITYDDNIELLENLPKEKSMYKMETLKRMFYIFADYKFGIRIKHIGTKVKDTDPDAFKVQTVWTNGMPMFPEDFFVRLYDDTTGEINIKEAYSNITITNDWATNIDTITGTYEGQIVRIKGNTGIAATKNVTDDGNISLTGNADFDLSTGGTLTLRANTDGSLTEIKRTTQPEQAPDPTVKFTEDTLDANEGVNYEYIGTAATLAEILNGVEGQTIKITGTASGDLTINDVAGNINVGSAAVVSDGDDISFTLVDGVWEEVERNIAGA
ncbi:MAG: hypothetical protein CMM93_08680 [Rickettsiales bacterium]|nr:hypothetical protein [Rickettsiales bacterium]